MAPRRLSLVSTVATKFLLALTGLSLVGFLCMHLIGNLLLYVGAGTFNAYAHALISNPLVIPAELGLVALFLLHGFEAVTMWLSNQSARPIGYVNKQNAGGRSRKTVASSTMIVTGLVMGVFLVIHVVTMKYGAWYATVDTPEVRDLSRLVVETLRQPPWAAFYAVCMVAVGFHLWHGFSSAFESLGLNHPNWTPKVLAAGRLIAVVIGAGFFSIPLVLFFIGSRS